MAHISLREAAKRYNVTRPTLSKALNIGKISGKRNAKGHWTIDTSELARVYKVRESIPVKSTDDFTERNGNENDVGTPEMVKKHSALQAELEAMHTKLAVAEALADERGRMLDTMVKQITDQTKVRRKWWPFGQ